MIDVRYMFVAKELDNEMKTVNDKGENQCSTGVIVCVVLDEVKVEAPKLRLQWY